MMDSDLLQHAADLTTRAIGALDCVGPETDFAAAMLDHGLKLIEQLIVDPVVATGTRIDAT